MKKNILLIFFVSIFAILFAGCRATTDSTAEKPSTKKVNTQFTSTFTVNKKDLVPTGANPYFILKPGYTLLLKGKDEGKPASEETKVLNQTKVVDGVKTRVITETNKIDG